MICETCKIEKADVETGLCKYCLFELLTCGFSIRPSKEDWNKQIEW